MRARGITYDTGTFPGDQLTRKVFDTETVRQEMGVLARDLHCDAVRITGREPERLDIASRLAAQEGLEVWISPFPVDLPPAEVLSLLADCAARAEALRRSGAEVVLVAGCELSAFGHGFLPGDNHRDRLQGMAHGGLEWWTSLGPVQQRLNSFLWQSAEAIRSRFGGRTTYASGPWEDVDWEPFDLVGIDAYRAAYNAHDFAGHLQGIVAAGKPVAVTEFGTCAYRGAGELGGMAWQPPAGAVPDEQEQVRYLNELLDIFEAQGVDTAFWYTFANYDKPAARDIASYGVVRLLDETRWETKEVFHAMATRYGLQGAKHQPFPSSGRAQG